MTESTPPREGQERLRYFTDRSRNLEGLTDGDRVIFSVDRGLPVEVRREGWFQFHHQWLHTELGAPLGNRPADLSKITPASVTKLLSLTPPSEDW